FPPGSPESGRVSTDATKLQPHASAAVSRLGLGLKLLALPSAAYSLYTWGARSTVCHEYESTSFTSITLAQSDWSRPPSSPALKKKLLLGSSSSSGTTPSLSARRLLPLGSLTPSTIVNVPVLARSFFKGSGTPLNLKPGVASRLCSTSTFTSARTGDAAR